MAEVGARLRSDPLHSRPRPLNHVDGKILPNETVSGRRKVGSKRLLEDRGRRYCETQDGETGTETIKAARSVAQ